GRDHLEKKGGRRMEPGDLHVRIGRRNRYGRCAVLVRIFSPDGLPLDFETPIDIPSTTLATPVVSPGVPGLIGRHIVAHIERARLTGAIPQFYLPLRMLLEIEPLDLVGLDWENLLSVVPLVPSV